MANTPSTEFRTDHARMEQAFCSAPGLFASWPKPLPPDAHTDITYETTDAKFEFFGRCLGVTELRVFQAVLALTPISGPPSGRKLRLKSDSDSVAGKEHLRTLAADDIDLGGPSLVVRTTFYEIAKECGYAESCFHGGAQVKAIQKALETLWTVSVLIRHKTGEVDGGRLLSRYQADGNGKFTVAINPRLAEGIMGKRRYSRLDMNEIRALKTDPARFIHQRLCGFIDPGKSHKIALDTLAGYVWPEQALNINAIKYRKRAVRKALAELEALGWTVVEYAKEKFDVTRRVTPN